MDAVKRLFRRTTTSTNKTQNLDLIFDDEGDDENFTRGTSTTEDVLPRHVPIEDSDNEPQIKSHNRSRRRRQFPSFRNYMSHIFRSIILVFTTRIVSIWVFLINFLRFLVNIPKDVVFYFTIFTKNPKFDTENFYSNSSTTLTVTSAQITSFVTSTFNSCYRWSSHVITTQGGRTREKTFYKDNTMNCLQYVTHVLFFFLKCMHYIFINFKRLVKKKQPETTTTKLKTTTATETRTTTTYSEKNTLDQVYDAIVGFSARLRIPIFDAYLFEPTYYFVVSVIFKKIVNLFLRYVLFGVLHQCLKHHVFDIFDKSVEQNRSRIATIILNIFWKVYDYSHFLVVSLIIILFVFYFGGMMKELIWQKHVGDTIKTFWDNNNNNELETLGGTQDKDYGSLYDYESIINSINFLDDPPVSQSSNYNEQNVGNSPPTPTSNSKLSQQFYPSFERSVVAIGPNYSLSQIIKSDVYMAVVQACFTTCINFEKDSHSSFVKIVDYYKTDNTVSNLVYVETGDSPLFTNIGSSGFYNIVSDIFLGFYNTYARGFLRYFSYNTNSPEKRTVSSTNNNRLFQKLIQNNVPYNEVGDNNNIQPEHGGYVNLDILKCKNPVILLNRKQHESGPKKEEEEKKSKSSSTVFDDIVLWRRHIFKSICSSNTKTNSINNFADHSISYQDTVDNILEWQLFTYSSGNIVTLFSKPVSSRAIEERCTSFDKKEESYLTLPLLKEETQWLLLKSSELSYVITLNMGGNMKCEKSSTNIEEDDLRELPYITYTKHGLLDKTTIFPFVQEHKNSREWKYFSQKNDNIVSTQIIREINSVNHQYFVKTSHVFEKSFYNFVTSYMNTRKRLLSSVTGIGPDNGIYENLGSSDNSNNNINLENTDNHYFQFLPKVSSSVSSSGLELSGICSHIGYNNFKSGFLTFYTNTDAFNENSLWNPAFGINDANSLLYIQKFYGYIETKDTIPTQTNALNNNNNRNNPSQLNSENVVTLVEKTSKLGTKLGMRFFDKFKDSINNANSLFESYILSSLSYSTSSEQVLDESHANNNNNNNNGQSGGVEKNVIGFLPKQDFERSHVLRNLVVSRFKTLSKNVTGEKTRLRYPLFDLLITSSSSSPSSDNKEDVVGKSQKKQVVLDNTGELYVTSDRFFDNLFRDTENELNQLRNVVNAAVENFMLHSSKGILDENITKYMEMLEDVLGYELKEESKPLSSKKLVWNMNMCSCSLHHFILSDHVVSAHYQSEVHPVQKEEAKHSSSSSSYTTIVKSQVRNFTRGRVRSSDSALFKSSLLQSIKMMTDKNDGTSSPTVLYNFQSNYPISLSGINVVDYPTLSTENFYNLKNVAKTISSDWRKILNLIVHLPAGPVQFPILYEAAMADTYWTTWIDDNIINPNSFYQTKCDTSGIKKSQEGGGGETPETRIHSSYSKKEQELYINLHKTMSVFGFSHTSLVETYDRVENVDGGSKKKNTHGFQSSKYKKSTIKTSNYNDVMCLDYCNSLLGLLGNVAYLEFTQDYATLLQKDRSQTFDVNTDYPSYYCPKEKWNECNNMWKKTGN